MASGDGEEARGASKTDEGIVDHTKHLQRENDRLQAQVEKWHDLGKRDVQDNSQARHSIARNKGNELIVPDNIDSPRDGELSPGNSPDLSPAKSSKAKSRQRHSHRYAFNNSDSGTFRRVRRETGRGKNQPNEVPGNASTLPTSVMLPMSPVYLAFDTGPTLYITPAAAIQSPNNNTLIQTHNQIY